MPDDAAWAEYRAAIEARKTPGRRPVSFVEVNGVSDGAGAMIARQLSRHIGTEPRAKDIEADLNRVIGLGRYASATYGRRITGESVGLGVEIRDKSYAPPFVRFSLDLNNENKDVNLNVGSRVTLMDVTGLGSEWRLDASLGSTLGVGTEFYQPIGGERPVRGGAFVSPRASYTRTTENLYTGGDLVAIYGRQRAGVGLDLGWNSGGSTRFRVGYETAYVRNITRVGDPLLPRSTGGEQALRARFDYDGRNAAYVATSGARLTGAAQWFLEAPNAPRRFGSIEGSVQIATPVRGSQIATFTADGGASFGGTPPTLYQFGLGGPFRLGAFPPYAFRGPKYVLGSVGYKAPVGHLPQLLGGRLYFQTLAEAGSVFDDFSRARLKTSVSAGFAADTLVGPIFGGFSVSHRGETRAYFMVGRLVR